MEPLLEVSWPPYVALRSGIITVAPPMDNAYWLFDEFLRQFVLWYISELRMPISIELPNTTGRCSDMEIFTTSRTFCTGSTPARPATAGTAADFPTTSGWTRGGFNQSSFIVGDVWFASFQLVHLAFAGVDFDASSRATARPPFVISSP